MDYFYVGNSHQGVGLWDKFLTLQHKPTGKFIHLLTLHQFSSQQPVRNLTTDQMLANNLGIEADYTVGYTFTKDIKLQGGYSQLFATPTLAYIKGGNTKATQNWTWLMLTFSTALIKVNL